MAHSYNLRTQRAVNNRYEQDFVTTTRRRSNTWELELPKTLIRTNSLDSTQQVENIRLSDSMDTPVRQFDSQGAMTNAVQMSSPETQLGNPILELLNQLNSKLEVMGEHNLNLDHKLEFMGSNMDRKLEVMSEHHLKVDQKLENVNCNLVSKLDSIQEGLQGLSLRLSSFEQKTEKDIKNLKQTIDQDRNVCAKNNSMLAQKLDKGLSQTNAQLTKLHTHIDTKIAEVTHKHTQLSLEIQNTARTCDEKITHVADNVSTQLSKLEHNILETKQQFTENLKSAQQNNTSPTTPIIVQCANTNNQMSKLPTFKGEPLYAIEFLEKINTYIRRYFHDSNNDLTLHELISESLKHEALSWFNMCKNKINNIDDFNRLFQNKYWGDTIQREVRRCLEFERYNPNSKQDRCAYFVEKVNIMRRLNPPMSDELIIKQLMEHFGETIRIACRVQGINTVEQMEQLLTEADNDTKFHGVKRQQVPILHTHIYSNNRSPIINQNSHRPNVQFHSSNANHTRYNDQRNPNMHQNENIRQTNYRPYQDARLQTQPYNAHNRFPDIRRNSTYNARPNQYSHTNDRPNTYNRGYRTFNENNRSNSNTQNNSIRPFNNRQDNNSRPNHTVQRNTSPQNRPAERPLNCNHLEQLPVNNTPIQNTNSTEVPLNGSSLA